MTIIDWYPFKVLSWHLSNIMDDDFSVQAVNAVIQIHACPEIMNTGQGVQFLSTAFIEVLQRHRIQISMDGKGCYYDNIFVKRLVAHRQV